MENNNIAQALDEMLDWMSDLPEEKIRRRYRELKIPRNVDFRWTIGGTEYTVVSHFKKDSADDITGKVRRLMEDEATR